MEKYIKCLFGTIFICAALLLLTTLLPNSLIKNNMEETALILRDTDGTYVPLVTEVNEKVSDSVSIDYFADTITFNILWNLNKGKNPFESMIMMRYASGYTASNGIYESVFKNLEAKSDYSRYWHGQIVYIKPLLMFFNINEIKIINSALIISLTLYLLYLLFKKSKKMFIAFLISSISILFFIVPLCFEFFFCYLIMLIVSIITVKSLNKNDSFFFGLMIISGALTSFMDFLSCETLTLSVPLLLRFYFNNHNKNVDFKEQFFFIFKTGFSWGVGYGVTFIVKWLLTVLLLGTRQIANILACISIRTGNPAQMNFFGYLSVIYTLLTRIFPFSLISDSILKFGLICLLFVLLVIFVFTKEKRKYFILLLFIALIPIARFVFLFAHSFIHSFMTYRAFLPTLMIIMIILLEGIFYKK